MSEAFEVVATGAAAAAVGSRIPTLVEESFASRRFAKDPSLWGEEAEPEAAKRLSWVGLPRSSRPLVDEVSALRSELADAGLDHVVLCGMGGSSLAPEVICATAGVELTVLDSSNPDQVRHVVRDRLDRAVVVVSSKSGSTVETDSQRRAYEQAFTEAGIEPATRIVVVTDPGSPLDKEARAAGYRVVNADPDVGGRYSALTAFGLVPSGLAGADIGALLDEAAAVRRPGPRPTTRPTPPCVSVPPWPAPSPPLRDKLVLVDDGSGLPGFADWAEQLIAESTGKNGTGVLPVVVQTRRSRGGAATARRDGRPPRAGPLDPSDDHAGPADSADLGGSGGGVAVTCRHAGCPAAAVGGAPPRPPAGSWGSTPSTSPTSRAPRTPPGRCSDGDRGQPARRPSPTARSRSGRPRPAGSAMRTTSRPPWAAARRARRRQATSR